VYKRQPGTSTEENPGPICYNTPGEYDVTLTLLDVEGNTFTQTFSDYITVSSCSPPEASFSIPSTICAGSCIDLVDESLNSPITWMWNFEGGTPVTSTEENPEDICFDNPGTYAITLTCSNEYGEDSFTQEIIVAEPPFAGSDVIESFCNETPDVSLFDLITDESESTGDWYALPSFEPLEAPYELVDGVSNYCYVLSETYGEVTCSDTAFVETIIGFSPEVSLGEDMTWCSNEILTISATVENASDLSLQEGSEGSFFSYKPGFSDLLEEQVFTVIASNYCGSEEATINVEFVDCELYVFVPNAFTPDGNSINGVFKPSVLANEINDFNFSIYDRWGELIFTSNDPDIYWTGEYENGLIQDGVYVWVLTFDYSSSEKKKKYTATGHVLLIK